MCDDDKYVWSTLSRAFQCSPTHIQLLFDNVCVSRAIGLYQVTHQSPPSLSLAPHRHTYAATIPAEWRSQLFFSASFHVRARVSSMPCVIHCYSNSINIELAHWQSSNIRFQIKFLCNWKLNELKMRDFFFCLFVCYADWILLLINVSSLLANA